MPDYGLVPKDYEKEKLTAEVYRIGLQDITCVEYRTIEVFSLTDISDRYNEIYIVKYKVTAIDGTVSYLLAKCNHNDKEVEAVQNEQVT